MACLQNHPDLIEAKTLGKKKWLGPDCKRAHGGERWVVNGQCVGCGRNHSRESSRTKHGITEAALEEKSALRAAGHKARAIAKEAGENTFHGIPCTHGCGTLRLTTSGTCFKCYYRPSKWDKPRHALNRLARQAARDRGEKTYEGMVCPHEGHGATRITGNGTCRECSRVRALARSRKYAPPRKRDDPTWVAALEAQKIESAARERARKQTPEYKAANALRCKAYQKANRDTLLAKSKIYAEDPDRREAKREWDRAYSRANHLRYRAHRHARKARERGAEGFTTPEELAAIIEAHDGLCAYCGVPWEHMDHKTPLIRKGTNWPDNLQPLCGFHNMSKGRRTDEEYRLAMGFPSSGRFVCAA